MKKSVGKRFLAGILVSIFLMGFVAYADYGDSSDPLVTLSYITSIFKPSILSEIDQKISDATGGTVGSSFKVVSLSSGQSLIGAVGTEVMLRVGTATCVASSSPGLVDSSDAGVLDGGGALKTNHLYMVTVEGRGLKAGSEVKVVVRGTYTIS